MKSSSASSIAGVDRRRLVLGEHPLPDARWRAGPRRATPSSCHCSKLLLSATSRAVERGLEVGQRVGACRGSACPGSLVADRVERLAVLGQVDALDEDGHHPALVGVEDELLVADGQPALEPAGRVEHEVDAAEDGRLERRRRSRRPPARRRSSRRTASRPSGTGRRAGGPGRPSRTARAPAPASRTSARPTASTSSDANDAEDDRRARPDELDEGHAGERLGEGLGARRRPRSPGPSRRRG